MILLRFDLLTYFFYLTGPNFDPGLELIEINILAKLHKDCIKTLKIALLSVYMVFQRFDLMTLFFTFVTYRPGQNFADINFGPTLYQI